MNSLSHADKTARLSLLVKSLEIDIDTHADTDNGTNTYSHSIDMSSQSTGPATVTQPSLLTKPLPSLANCPQ